MDIGCVDWIIEKHLQSQKNKVCNMVKTDKGRTMRKGVAIKTIIELVLIVVLIVGVFMAMGWIPGLATYAADFLFGRSLENLAPSGRVLEEAIKCAYYRCKDGCNTAIENVDDSIFSCADYCKAEWTDTGNLDGKICGKKYVLKVLVAKDTTLKKFDPFGFMALTSCSKTTPERGFEASIGIDENAIVSWGCSIDGVYKQVQNDCMIRGGTYYVWDEVDYAPIGSRVQDSAIICGEEQFCDVTLEQSKEKEVTFPSVTDIDSADKILCIKGSDYKAKFTYKEWDAYSHSVNALVNDQDETRISYSPHVWSLEGGHTLSIKFIDATFPVIGGTFTFAMTYT